LSTVSLRLRVVAAGCQQFGRTLRHQVVQQRRDSVITVRTGLQTLAVPALCTVLVT